MHLQAFLQGNVLKLCFSLLLIPDTHLQKVVKRTRDLHTEVGIGHYTERIPLNQQTYVLLTIIQQHWSWYEGRTSDQVSLASDVGSNRKGEKEKNNLNKNH